MATVVTAVGGALEMSGDAGELAATDAGLTVMPLSVTLTGALVIARGFLRPLRHRPMADAAELAGWAGRIAVLWLLALLGTAFAARQTFEVSLGEALLNDLGDLFGVSPTVGFTTDVPLTVLFGLLWLAGVLVLALLVSHRGAAARAAGVAAGVGAAGRVRDGRAAARVRGRRRRRRPGRRRDAGSSGGHLRRAAARAAEPGMARAHHRPGGDLERTRGGAVRAPDAAGAL
ncbi:hypothetical protein STENM327S_09333 [Streptomyces tendae]